MKRPLFNVAAGVSLAILIAATSLWIRGFSKTAGYAVRLADSVRFIQCDQGVFEYLYLRVPKGRERVLDNTMPRTGWFTFHAQSWVGAENWPGFGFKTETANHFYVLDLMVPASVPAVLSTLIPVLWLRRAVIESLAARRRRKAQLRGVCATCGYDLRASPIKCPECGTRVEAGEMFGRRLTSNWNTKGSRA